DYFGYVKNHESLILGLEKDYLKRNLTKIYLPSEEIYDYIENQLNIKTTTEIVEELNQLNIKSIDNEIAWTEESVKKLYENKSLKLSKSSVSVIIAGRNYGKFLRDCIRSIITQI